MHLVALLEAAQDADGVLHRRGLDQNGLEEDENTEPNIVTVGAEEVADVVGRYAKNPVVPIDDMLQDIDVILNVELVP